MEKIRVPKGEEYWYVDDCGFVTSDFDTRSPQDDIRYEIGNYFSDDSESIRKIARKLHAVLKGADVIEMPSEANIKAVAIRRCGPLAQWSGSTIDAFIECAEWLKSKIVK